MTSYLPAGLPHPLAAGDGLDTAYWEGTRVHELRIQRCKDCRRWQWGPEWICHRCHSFALAFEPTVTQGVLFAYERIWHPVSPVLTHAIPYVVALVELPEADLVRVVGNLLGDPLLSPPLGSAVIGEFEDHDDAPTPFTLLHWRVV